MELGIEFKKIKLGKKYFYGSAQKSLVFSHTQKEIISSSNRGCGEPS